MLGEGGCLGNRVNVYAAGEEGWGGGVERWSGRRGLPEADFGEGGEGGERRSHGRRSLGPNVIFPAHIIYIYIHTSQRIYI